MTRVPNGREERKTARDGIRQGRVKKLARDGTPGPMKKNIANGGQVEKCVQIGSGLIVRAMEKDASEKTDASCQGGKAHVECPCW